MLVVDDSIEKDAEVAALVASGKIERVEALELTKIYVGILKAIASQAQASALSAVQGALS